MPIITGHITDHGAVITIRVGASRNLESLMRSQGLTVPQRVALVAQLDTGSFVTALSPDAFQSLRIGPFSKIAVRTPSTKQGAPHVCDQYDVSIELISGMTPTILPSVKVIAAEDFDENVQAIIGRDVLKCCNFQYFGPANQFNLAF